MAQTLHEVDEETDVGAYRAYLRAQTDGDLFDIVRHLDPERYPARLDAATREFRRRRVLPLPLYTTNEYAIRYVALGAFALAAATAALTFLLTPAAAAGPPWPEGIPDDTPVIQVAATYLTAALRGVALWGARLGVYDFLWGALGFWTLTRGVRLPRRHARADVWRLSLAAWAALTAAMLLAGGGGSSVPDLFPGAAPRATALFQPFH